MGDEKTVRRRNGFRLLLVWKNVLLHFSPQKCTRRLGSLEKCVLLHFSPQNLLLHLGRSRLILLEFVTVVVHILWIRISTHLEWYTSYLSLKRNPVFVASAPSRVVHRSTSYLSLARISFCGESNGPRNL